MSRYTKTQVTQLSANEQAALNNINKNFDDIQNAIQDTVSRSGNTPTHMTNDLDMNGNRIINVPAPTSDTDLVRRQDVVGDIALVQNLVNATTNAAAQTLQAAADVQEIIQDRNVGLVADDLGLGENSKIKLCGENIDDIEAVSNNITNITSVANNETNINTVSADKENIDIVAGDKANIDIVASKTTEITNVSTNISDVSNISDNMSDVSNVSNNMSDVSNCSDNMSAILDAPTQASNAASSAESAAASAASIDPSSLVHKTGDESSVRGMVYTVVSSLPADPDSDMLYLIPE